MWTRLGLALAKLLTGLTVALAVGLMQYSGLFRGVDQFATDNRARLDQIEATGDIVFLAIDRESLAAISTWPWPRSVHGQIVEALSDHGATDVLLDIDFSAPSTPEMDLALSEAIGASDSLVVLAAFAQESRIGARGRELAFNTPIPLIARDAWLGAVNVMTGQDGIVRTAPFGIMIDGADIPSFPALIGGTFGPPGSEFAINFSIDPSTVPTFSVIDLLEGRLGPEHFEGKAVVVGAHALELRDSLSVPVYGTMSGPMLQILAAETLRQDLALRTFDPFPALAVLCLLASFAQISSRLSRLRRFAVLVAVAALVVEGTATYLQLRFQIVLPSAVLHAFLASTFFLNAARELELRKLFLLIASREARNTRDLLARVVSDSGDGILVVDENGDVIECNARWKNIFGTDLPVLEGYWLRGVPEEMAVAIAEAFERKDTAPPAEMRVHEVGWTCASGLRYLEFTVTPSRMEKAGRRGGGSVEIAFVCVTARDITRRQEQKKRIDYLSRYDPVSGAMRPNEIAARLAERLGQAAATGEHVAVWVFNLQQFKTVNATLGLGVGDKLLAAVVERLASMDMGLSHSARLGGGVFAVFNATGSIAQDQLEPVAQQICETIRRPISVDGNTVFSDAAVGIASTHGLGAGGLLPTSEQLLDHAETALNEILRSGTRMTGVFDPQLVRRQERARLLERELWTSIENDELFVVYQPQVRLSDLGFCGAEALIRWNHPTLGLVSPGEFIPAAEASGFVQQIGQFVLWRACEDFARSDIPGTIAVNVSPQQFLHGDLLGDVRRVLRDTGLSGSRLHLEMTESLFVESSEQLREMLGDIRALGVSLALDDFGSGFSSFGYLARFRIDKIKADQMFVRSLRENANNEGILKSIRLLADELGTKLICEGIETEDQARFLREIGCDEGQGYLFGKPMGFRDLLAFAGTSGSRPMAS